MHHYQLGVVAWVSVVLHPACSLCLLGLSSGFCGPGQTDHSTECSLSRSVHCIELLETGLH